MLSPVASAAPLLDGSLPASLRQRRVALAFAALLFVIALFALPVARDPGPVIAPFLPAYITAVMVFELLTAVLFTLQFRQHMRASTLVLACAYLYTGLAVIPHILTFPGVFSPTGLLGAGSQTSVWLWVSWHGGYPLFLLAHALLLMREQRKAAAPACLPMLPALAGVVILVLLLTLIATLGAGILPTIIAKDNYLALITSGVGPTVLLFNLAALTTLWRATGRASSVTQLWLLNAALASVLDVSITLAAGARYSFGWYAARVNSLLCASAVLGAFLFEFYRLQVQLSAANKRLTALADTDGLTELFNRRAFDRRIAEEWARGARSAEPLAVLLLDVDQFKLYNDSYGHQRGDDCLRAVAGAIRGALRRPSDFAARYGGEEMVLLLPNTTLEGALHVAERLRASIEALGLEHRASTRGVVTASIGVAAEVPNAYQPVAGLISRADTALYAAKNGGRNRVES